MPEVKEQLCPNILDIYVYYETLWDASIHCVGPGCESLDCPLYRLSPRQSPGEGTHDSGNCQNKSRFIQNFIPGVPKNTAFQ